MVMLFFASLFFLPPEPKWLADIDFSAIDLRVSGDRLSILQGDHTLVYVTLRSTKRRVRFTLERRVRNVEKLGNGVGGSYMVWPGPRKEPALVEEHNDGNVWQVDPTTKAKTLVMCSPNSVRCWSIWRGRVI